MSDINKSRYLIARDCASVRGLNEGNLSKMIKSGKVKTEEKKIYIKGDGGFHSLGDKTIQVIDMEQFKSKE